MGVFMLVWIGQFISALGSGLTNFALGIWVLQRSGSVTQFAVINICGVLPPLVLSPLAGALADRWERRYIMIVADCGGLLTSLTLALLLATGQLGFVMVCVCVLLYSGMGVFQRPAYSSSISLLVPQEHLGRANGLHQIAGAGTQMFAPMAAGFLMAVVQIQTIILMDVATFLFAIAMLVIVKFPPVPRSPGENVQEESLLTGIREGWKYLYQRSGLLMLLLFISIVDFMVALAGILTTPLILSFASPAVIGTIASVGGMGMLAGGVLMGSWGGPKRRIDGVLWFSIALGGFIAIAGIRPSWILFAVAAFGAFFSIALTNACGQAVFQSRVTASFQGRIFATTQLVYAAVAPLAYIVAGPLADQVFEPLLSPDGLLATTVGKVVGVGHGRGIGFLFIVIGLMTAVTSAFGFINRSLRSLNGEVSVSVAESVGGQTSPTKSVA
jgi:MFS transporter, DHA3 family, macrolide efflux protein